MKTILTATDFSAAGHNACRYAAELAKTFDARLILLNAFERKAVPVADTGLLTLPEDTHRLVEEQLNSEAMSINPYRVLRMEKISREDSPSNAILDVTREKKADLIIIGMKSEGKGIRKMLGSTVTDLLRKTSIPIIVIPESAEYKRIDTIAMANESDIEPDADAHVLDTLREIAENFQSKLFLIRIAKTKFKEIFEAFNPPFRLTKILWTLDPEYECIRDKEIPHALNEFIKKFHINLLAMLPHNHSLLERWFTGSTTRSMIFETEIPLLIMPEKRDNTSISGSPGKEIVL